MHARDAVAQIRSGMGPVLLEFLTYRWREHCGPNFDNDIGYRTVEEYETWRQRDPLAICGKRLLDEGVLSQEEMRTEAERIHFEIDDAVAFAQTSPFPDSKNCMCQVYA
jgi:pyruvate dehydrogenase E1 component alpha subunit